MRSILKIIASLKADIIAVADEKAGAEIRHAAMQDELADIARGVTYLQERLHGPRRWLDEAVAAQARGPERLTVRQTHRLDIPPTT